MKASFTLKYTEARCATETYLIAFSLARSLELSESVTISNPRSQMCAVALSDQTVSMYDIKGKKMASARTGDKIIHSAMAFHPHRWDRFHELIWRDEFSHSPIARCEILATAYAVLVRDVFQDFTGSSSSSIS